MTARERFDDIVDAITAWNLDCRASQVFGLARTGMMLVGAGLARPAGGVSPAPTAMPGAHLFDPSARGETFRQWVVVPPDRADEWEPLAAEAVVQDHSIPPPPR